jgi:ribosomal protein S18 acetylase RimI-like enzyme
MNNKSAENPANVIIRPANVSKRVSPLISKARAFYEKYGFQIFATIEDYPIGHKRYYLLKKLGRPIK